ncbi:uncharacterized protein B0T15DRAFT_575433 [Chaetomium strumarium]|uniref:beta-glucosidase n=1 Tax=Chaetomium strumarium TaxID=1170767 RepID=A0AAJ0GPQ4_9PEZI|nr:hypothetical protein B0T15DRAFT_575433 [Chaetomium strumarium]
MVNVTKHLATLAILLATAALADGAEHFKTLLVFPTRAYRKAQEAVTRLNLTQKVALTTGYEIGVQASAKHYIGNEQEMQRSNTSTKDGHEVAVISSNIGDRTMHEHYMWDP